MVAMFEKLTRDALKLSEPERASLAQALLRSLDPVVEEDVEAAWDGEVTRRLERVQQGTAQGRPADEVFRDIRARYDA